MNRLAGERLGSAAGRGNLQASDIVTSLAALGGLGGLTVTGLMGLIDLFNGEARIDNSGEYLANSAIGAIPFGTAAAGAGLVAASDPVARGLLTLIDDVAAAREAGRDYGADALMASMAPGEAPAPNRRGVDAATQRVNASAERIAEALRQKLQANPALTPEMVFARSGRNLVRGAGLGALGGAVPAVMLMMDQPHQQGESKRG